MAARLRQSGFTLIVYALVALAVVGTLSGIAWKIRESGKDAVRAELQPQIDACQAAIAAQNAAVEALRAEAAKRQAAASKALAGATQKARTWEDNAARLRAVLTAPRPAGEAAPTDCKAAWQEIRK